MARQKLHKVLRKERLKCVLSKGVYGVTFLLHLVHGEWGIETDRIGFGFGSNEMGKSNSVPIYGIVRSFFQDYYYCFFLEFFNSSFVHGIEICDNAAFYALFRCDAATCSDWLTLFLVFALFSISSARQLYEWMAEGEASCYRKRKFVDVLLR